MASFRFVASGLVNNLNDVMVWGLVSIYLVGVGLSLKEVALTTAVYPGVWGVG